MDAPNPTPENVTVFPTCLGDLTMPDMVERTFSALRACGFSPKMAEGVTCCGQPAFNSGFDAQARRVARVTMKALARTDGPIVVPAGSCSAMMILHWRELFRGTRHERDAIRVSQRVAELTTVLASRVDRLQERGLRWDGRVAYHDSCHMFRELRIADAPRAVLGAVAGTEVITTGVAPRCCGFGGTFSLRYPEVSTAMGDATLNDASAADVDAVVSADPGCLMHLAARRDYRDDKTPRVMHIATFLHEAGLR